MRAAGVSNYLQAQMEIFRSVADIGPVQPLIIPRRITLPVSLGESHCLHANDLSYASIDGRKMTKIAHLQSSALLRAADPLSSREGAIICTLVPRVGIITSIPVVGIKLTTDDRKKIFNIVVSAKCTFGANRFGD